MESLIAKSTEWALTAALSILASTAPVGVPLTSSTKTNRTAVPTRLTGGSTYAPVFVPVKPRPAPRTTLVAAFTKPVPVSMSDLRSMEQQVKALVARVSPAVVAVEVGNASGSGVVISEDGLVLTAGHVCGSPNRDVRFTFPDGKTARGKTVGLDRDSDTGLMRITDRGPWTHAAVGELKNAGVGDWALALGHPGGFDRQRSLVVRLGRIIRMNDDSVQTDCTISPGDSGGPLFDMLGRVIGIHSAISGSLSANYHVPITQFLDSWEVLTDTAVLASRASSNGAYLGVKAVDDAAGCSLAGVDRNGPASKAGLKSGDIVLRIEGREISGSAALLRWVAESRPGETLKMDIKRGDLTLSIPVKLAQLPPTR